jgi:hypothetical protein
MKGKKADQEFIINYIQESIKLGIYSPIDILNRAKESILQIDEEIKLINEKKKLRSKLLDVVFKLKDSQ